VGLFTAFGLALSWIYLQLVTLPVSSEAAAAEGVSVQAINRRQFLVRVGGATAVLTVVGAGLGRLLREDLDRTEVASSTEPISTPEPEATAMAEATDMPDATAMLEPAPGTRPEYTPLDEHYRIDISTRPPRIREAEWALLINGLVEAESTMTLSDLRNNYEPVDQLITLSCISNRVGGSLISTTRWTGVPLRTLLEDWNVSPEASYMKITSADGFDEYVSLNLAREDERVMLTYEWDGKPLKEKHGFPVRIYIPDHYGMKQPKWIIGIEMVDEWDEGYWVRRGWSETALVRTTSVVDTVATDSIYEQGSQMYVPVGGIAYSGARGISKVEVQVDEGEWTEAQLLKPLSQLTWVLWRYDWPFQAGEHTFAVRCYDGNGTLQITERNDVRPDGATGIHTRSADIEQAQVSA
jgi:DMSO/TMAO reductase YedYZ molybdopterin-dependent catalytic subunit